MPTFANTLTVKVNGASYDLPKDDLANLPQLTLSIRENSTLAKYVGPSLVSVLGSVGFDANNLKGRDLKNILLAKGQDGFYVPISLTEVDATFESQVFIVALSKDGAPLASDGPLKLVVRDAGRASRRLKSLVEIEVRTLAP